MPQSWVKAPTGSSQKMRACMGGDLSRGKWESCAHQLVGRIGARVDEIRYPHQGWAHLQVSYDHRNQLDQILTDLDGQEISGP
jgi:hypothetical protein